MAHKRRPPTTVVGIGASAGGLTPLRALFSRLRPDLGMAYVVVVHLSPDYESNLADILQRETKMKVTPVRQRTPLERDRVYVIPPNKMLTVTDRGLILSPRKPGGNMPVDHFLRSLAEDRKRRAIAVILSGSGHDGALGVSEVKNAGGLVFAQDQASCAHGEMPRAAEATGAVDAQLPAEEIAAELERISRHPYLSAGLERRAVTDDAAGLRKLFALVREQTGVDFSQYKPTTVGRRLTRRLVLHKLSRLDDYLKLLKQDPAEVRAFCEDTLIHVTRFFREPEAFAALTKLALPRILKEGGKDDPIRVWVPGCSTGEEAYSLAITLLDEIGDRVNRRPIQVFATDVSDAAVDRARLGAYPEGMAADVPPRLLRRYFTRTDGGYQVSKAVRDACIFAKQNLAVDPPFANLDVVSCRNVMIYLEPSLQRRIIPIFHYALKPWGALVLGAAETVGDHAALFSPADKKTRLYLKKPSTTPIRAAVLARTIPEIPPMPPKPGKPKLPRAWPESDVQKAAERLLLTRFAPAGVVVSADLEILHFRGPINRYLKPASGRASLSLLKMLPDDCHPTLHALIKKAQKTDAPARQAGVRLEVADKPCLVTLEVLPFQGPASNERCFIVLFEPPAGPAAMKLPKAPKDGSEDRRVRKELASTKDYLQSIIEDHEAANEELKAANEEIISSNEELQSTNEELETAKEELQAANEELTTLNEELQTRNVDLSVVNNDLVNLLASVHLPIVMLGADLRVRRFTPLAERMMNLIPGDIGRPIGDIKTKIGVENLEDLVSEVIESVTTRELEVRDKAGRWHSLRIRPYKTTENKIDGAVLVLIDIDAVKKGILDLRERTLFSEAVFDLVSEPLAVLDGSSAIKTANKAFQRLAGANCVGRSLFECAGARWNAKGLRSALGKLLAEGDSFGDLSLEGGKLKASGRRLGDEGLLLSLTVTQP